MIRCCEGETYTQPNGPDSWAVLCFDCHAVLAVVDGVEREEVFADL